MIHFLFSWFSISFLRTRSCLTTDWRRRTSLWPLVWAVGAPPGSHQPRQRSCRCWTFPSCSSRSWWVRWPLFVLNTALTPSLPRCWLTPWSQCCSPCLALSSARWPRTWPPSSSGLPSLSGDHMIMTSGVWWHDWHVPGAPGCSTVQSSTWAREARSSSTERCRDSEVEDKVRSSDFLPHFTQSISLPCK